MKNFQEKSSFRRFVESKPFLIFLFLLLLLYVWNILNFWDKRNETKKNLEIVQNKITELEKNKSKLQADIDTLDTKEGVEENIREKYGLVKDGEEVIIVVDDKNAPIPVPEKQNVFTKIKNWFK